MGAVSNFCLLFKKWEISIVKYEEWIRCMPTTTVSSLHMEVRSGSQFLPTLESGSFNWHLTTSVTPKRRLHIHRHTVSSSNFHLSCLNGAVEDHPLSYQLGLLQASWYIVQYVIPKLVFWKSDDVSYPRLLSLQNKISARYALVEPWVDPYTSVWYMVWQQVIYWNQSILNAGKMTTVLLIH